VEGLRAIAASTVLVYHVFIFGGRPEGPAIALPGDLETPVLHLRFGLTLFFVLSGFLLFRPFAAAVLRAEPLPRPGVFLTNRALRIFPAYWVILLVAALVLHTAVVSVNPVTTGALTDPGTLAADLLLVQMYSLETAFTGIGPAWSLCVEAVFYLSLPLAGLAMAALVRRGTGRLAAVLAPVAALFVLGVLTRVAIAQEVGDAAVRQLLLRQSFPAQADLFALGMAVAVIHELVRMGRIPARPVLRQVAIAAAVATALLVVASPRTTTAAGGPIDLLAAFGSAALVLACCLSPPSSRGIGVLESRPLLWLGLCSYSVYLWHTPVIFFIERHVVVADDGPTLAAAGLLAIAATLALSAVTYRFVERPALARKRRPASRA
jgi:peptidoglycan/LPS O-acetylase OafA/YrhL